MWNRQLHLEPELAEWVLRTVEATLPEVGNWDAAYPPLGASLARCESMRIVQMPRKLEGEEALVRAVFFAESQEPRNVVAVIWSVAYAATLIEGIRDPEAQDDRFAEAARRTLGDLPAELGLELAETPVYVEDMHATALGTLATMASLNRQYGVITCQWLRGAHPSFWGQRIVVCDVASLRRWESTQEAA